jgi:hypothetical protein
VKRRAIGMCVLAAGLAAPASAQDRAGASPATRAPAAPQPFRVYGHVDRVGMSATQSFDAVLGSSSFIAVGGGIDVIDVWRRAFARLALSRMGGDGSRVFAFDGEIVPLNVPVEVRMNAIEVAGGWRFAHPSLPTVTFYGGAGLLRVGYSEKSPFAEGEDNATGFFGQMVFGGVEVPVRKWMVAGVEVQHRHVPNAIGDGGVSAAFGESNLGGFVLRVLVGIRK